MQVQPQRPNAAWVAKTFLPHQNNSLTLDKMLEGWQERGIEELERDMFGDDDEVGYYDYDDYESWMPTVSNAASECEC